MYTHKYDKYKKKYLDLKGKNLIQSGGSFHFFQDESVVQFVSQLNPPIDIETLAVWVKPVQRNKFKTTDDASLDMALSNLPKNVEKWHDDLTPFMKLRNNHDLINLQGRVKMLRDIGIEIPQSNTNKFEQMRLVQVSLPYGRTFDMAIAGRLLRSVIFKKAEWGKDDGGEVEQRVWLDGRCVITVPDLETGGTLTVSDSGTELQWEGPVLVNDIERSGSIQLRDKDIVKAGAFHFQFESKREILAEKLLFRGDEREQHVKRIVELEKMNAELKKRNAQLEDKIKAIRAIL